MNSARNGGLIVQSRLSKHVLVRLDGPTRLSREVIDRM